MLSGAPPVPNLHGNVKRRPLNCPQCLHRTWHVVARITHIYIVLLTVFTNKPLKPPWRRPWLTALDYQTTWGSLTGDKNSMMPSDTANPKKPTYHFPGTTEGHVSHLTMEPFSTISTIPQGHWTLFGVTGHFSSKGQFVGEESRLDRCMSTVYAASTCVRRRRGKQNMSTI